MGSELTRENASALYWRNAYEELVRQTGRDLNDGYGIDPRKASPAPTSRPPVGDEAVETVAQALYEIEPWCESGECIDGFQVSPGGALSWRQAKRLRDEFGGDAEHAGPWSVVEDCYSTARFVLERLAFSPVPDRGGE